MMKEKKNNRPGGKSKINLLNINTDERSSRFVVDLKNNTEAQNKEKTSVYKKKEIVLSWLEKVVEYEFYNNFIRFKGKAIIYFKELLSRKKEKLLVFFSLFKLKQKKINRQKKEENSNEPRIDTNPIESSSFRLSTQIRQVANNFWFKNHSSFKKFENLAFFNLIFSSLKIVFKILKVFYRLSYRVGWLALFILKFIYFTFVKFGSGIFYFLNKSRIKGFKKAKSVGLKLNKFKIFLINKLNNFLLFTKKGIRSIINFYTKKDEDNEFHHEPLDEFNDIAYPKKTFWKLFKPVFSFAIILLVLVLPFKAFTYYKSLDLNGLKGKVLGVTETAVNDFMEGVSGAGKMDFKKANDSFSLAGDNFIKAQDQLKNINGLLFVLASIIPREDLKMASISRDILEAGKIASRLGVLMSNAFSGATDFENKNLIEIISIFAENTKLASSESKKLNIIFDSINLDIIPEESRGKFKDLKEKTLDLEKGLSSFNEIADNLKAFLGANKDKRYLVVFQNNTELRASGGFIGSYALVDFRDGKIRNMEVPTGGAYDTEAGLTELVAAPEPLHLVDPLWHFWDANWWPDWEKSAKKLMWFYEKSDGPTVDGVISFTPTVLENLLTAIGPIDMSEDYGVIINSENFWLTTQAIAEEKLKKEQEIKGIKHEPKKIIGDLLNKILEELPKRMNKDVLINFLQIIEDSLSEKHILFYFNDLELQEKIKEYGWAGKMEDVKLDYLSVINTNIAGGKSDRKMKEKIDLEVNIKPDGTVINTLKIKRKHTGIKREPFSGVRNVNWMRVYVPSGSKLIEANGFRRPDKIYFEDPDIAWKKDADVYREELNSDTHEESGTKIYKEEDKTVFANWSMVDPGEEAIIYIKYKLPFKIKEKVKEEAFLDSIKNFFNPIRKSLLPYSIQIQKQPGSMPSALSFTSFFPYNLTNAWQYPQNPNKEADSFSINDTLEDDKYYVVLLENIN